MMMGHYELTMEIKETEGSSSVEPEWGRIEKKNEKKRDEETTEAEDNRKVSSTNLLGSTDENQVKVTSSSNCENKTEGESDSGEHYEEWKEDPWHHPRENKDSEQHAESKQEDKGNAENEKAILNLTELTSAPEEKKSSSAEEHDAHQRSLIEPTWGKYKNGKCGMRQTKIRNASLPSCTLPTVR